MATSLLPFADYKNNICFSENPHENRDVFLCPYMCCAQRGQGTQEGCSWSPGLVQILVAGIFLQVLPVAIRQFSQRKHQEEIPS